MYRFRIELKQFLDVEWYIKLLAKAYVSRAFELRKTQMPGCPALSRLQLRRLDDEQQPPRREARFRSYNIVSDSMGAGGYHGFWMVSALVSKPLLASSYCSSFSI